MLPAALLRRTTALVGSQGRALTRGFAAGVSHSPYCYWCCQLCHYSWDAVNRCITLSVWWNIAMVIRSWPSQGELLARPAQAWKLEGKCRVFSLVYGVDRNRGGWISFVVQEEQLVLAILGGWGVVIAGATRSGGKKWCSSWAGFAMPLTQSCQERFRDSGCPACGNHDWGQTDRTIHSRTRRLFFFLFCFVCFCLKKINRFYT